VNLLPTWNDSGKCYVYFDISDMTSHLKKKKKKEKISMKTLKLDFRNARSYIIGLMKALAWPHCFTTRVMFGPWYLEESRHLLLKCMYQDRKVSDHVHMCARGIECAFFYDFSIWFWNCSDISDIAIGNAYIIPFYTFSCQVQIRWHIISNNLNKILLQLMNLLFAKYVHKVQISTDYRNISHRFFVLFLRLAYNAREITPVQKV